MLSTEVKLYTPFPYATHHGLTLPTRFEFYDDDVKLLKCYSTLLLPIFILKIMLYMYVNLVTKKTIRMQFQDFVVYELLNLMSAKTG